MSYKELLNNYKDEVADMLRELVSFRSVKAAPLEGMPFGEEVHKAYAYLLERAERDGFETFDADGYGGHIDWVGAVLDECGEVVSTADETIGIPVHLDVVPAGDDWTHDPWGGEVIDGRMYGRGTSDNKNAVCSIYYAMRALKESGYTPAKNIRLIVGLDEETGWSGMDRYFEKVQAPDFGFAPDADFPVINGEMGMMIFEIAKKMEISHENGLYLRSMSGGNAPNMVPDRCRAMLVYEDGRTVKSGKAKKSAVKRSGKEDGGREKAFAFVRDSAVSFRERTKARLTCKGVGSALEVSVQGISAHGAHPEKGVNAISVLMEFLSELPLVNEGARDFVDFYRTGIGRETDGKNLGIAMADGPSGSLIVNAGMIDLKPEAAILTINVRYPVSKKEEDVYDAMRPVLDANGLGVVKKSGTAPLYFAPDDPFVKTLMDVYQQNSGDMESRPIVIGGGTYARAIPQAVAYGPKFPDDEDVMHQKDEYIRLDSLMLSAQIYADAIYKLSQ